jgi:hypothetical protein
MIDEAMAAMNSQRRAAVVINDTNFDPKDETVRPPGWMSLRQKRVAAREKVDRLAGISSETIIVKHAQRMKDVRFLHTYCFLLL